MNVNNFIFIYLFQQFAFRKKKYFLVSSSSSATIKKNYKCNFAEKKND